jgi:ribosomal protein L32
MSGFSHMPRYDVRNDGAGPYAIFYCDCCNREFRSQPDIGNTVVQDIGRQAMGGLLRRVPLVGGAVASSVVGEDPRYSRTMTPAQVDTAWKQVQSHFGECPTCKRIVCLSDFDTRSGFCNDDTPRTKEIAEARGEQAGAAIKGLASAFGLGDAMSRVGEAAKTVSRASNNLARCPKDGTMAAPGTRFCPECGTAMVQPTVTTCPKCGAQTAGAKFCPSCGNKMEQAAPAGICPGCGAQTRGARFCPECGAKQG